MKKFTGKTSTGFQFEIDEEARDDMELLENFTAIAKGNLGIVPETIAGFLGEEQKKRLYEHCRGKSGRVSTKRVMTELDNIFAALRETDSDTKN